VKTSIAVVFLSVAIAAGLSACQPDTPTGEVLRAVRTAEIRYDKAQETNRYVGTVQSRHEVNEAFRVGGKVVQRKVDVGQKVREGDVLAVLDDTDYRHAEGAARQQLVAVTTQARQARRIAAARRVEERRLGERVRRREGADRCDETTFRRRRRPRRGSSSWPATG
jgi:multidrug efflux pump subunit AcrA (membrane-fusion protein)